MIRGKAVGRTEWMCLVYGTVRMPFPWQRQSGPETHSESCLVRYSMCMHVQEWNRWDFGIFCLFVFPLADLFPSGSAGEIQRPK